MKIQSYKTLVDMLNELSVMKHSSLKHQLLMANGYSIVPIKKFNGTYAELMEEEDAIADNNRK